MPKEQRRIKSEDRPKLILPKKKREKKCKKKIVKITWKERKKSKKCHVEGIIEME